MPPVTHLPYDEPVVATLSGVDKNGNPANFDSSVSPTWTISGIDGATDIVSADKLSAKVNGNKAGVLTVNVDLGSLPAAKGEFTFDPLQAVSGQIVFSSEASTSTPTPPSEPTPTP